MKDTLEPEPSIIVAPRARNNDSIFFHSIFDGVGEEKIDSSVFRCLLFTGKRYYLMIPRSMPDSFGKTYGVQRGFDMEPIVLSMLL